MADNDIDSKIKTTAVIVEEALRSMADKVADIFDEALNATSTYASSIEQDISKNLKSLARGVGTLESNQRKLNAGLLKQKDITKQIEERAAKLSSIQRLVEIAKLSEISLSSKANKLLQDAIAYETIFVQALKEQEEEVKRINKNLGVTGLLFEGLSKSLQKFGINSQIIDDIKDKLSAAAVKGKVSFGAAFKAISEGATEALKDPLVRFTVGLKLVKSGFDDIKKGINAFLEYDKIFVSVARNTGLTADQVKRVTNEAKAANTEIRGTNGVVTDTLYTTEQLAKSFGEINAQLGLSVDLGAETLNEFTAMTNQMGLSADEATKIYKLGLLNNMSLEDTNKAIVSGVIATQKQTGVQLNAKQILQEIGKLSAGITAKFQQNPLALAKAVAQAKALGTNLEQVEKVGESLLNFESSIESELKAELLTGKQINLEKARYAALTGDQATLTQELANQVGSLADFQGMNVIAQKSLAEAFGMSRDEVAGMLQQQEVFNKLGDVSSKSAAEQLAIAKKKGLSETDSLVVNLKQQATSEKIAAAFDSLKAALADVFEGFKPLLDMMVGFSKHTSLVTGALILMGGISFAKTIGGLVLMAAQLGLITSFKAAGAAADAASTAAVGAQVAETGALSAANATLTSEKIAQAVATAIANPFVAVAGMVAAAAAVAFIANAALSKPKMAKGGIIMPTPGGTDVTVGEAGSHEAIIPLNSSKAGEMLGINKPSSNSTPIDLTPVINIMNEVKNAISSLANRPIYTTITLDGRALGTAVGNQMETGTAQNMTTSYKLA
jgi:hypothetical protein